MGETTEATWSKRVERWKSSELTAAEFSRELGVSAASLKWWKWKLGSLAKPSLVAGSPSKPMTPRRDRKRRAKRSRRSATSPLTFVEMSAPVRSEPMEIILASGVRVRVASDFDASALARLLDTLGRRA